MYHDAKGIPGQVYENAKVLSIGNILLKLLSTYNTYMSFVEKVCKNNYNSSEIAPQEYSLLSKLSYMS